MSDIRVPLVTPSLPVARPARVQPVRREYASTGAAAQTQPSTVVAATGGSLRPAYAQFVVDQTTHDTIVRIRDANTGAIISESPTPEIQAMMRAMKAYADTVARHQAALHSAVSN